MSLWFGFEWEVAVSGTRRDGSVVPIPQLLDLLDTALVSHMRHVEARPSGWWLESSARYYRDASNGGAAHDELASAECSNPDELLLHTVAAERMMLRLADHVVTDSKLADVRVSKANVSFASVESWGSHENYEAGKPVPKHPMLAWLASRMLIAGSGGLDATYPGIRFTLSPRAHFIEEAVSNSTQHGRSLHNVGKADSLGNRHRVHVISGDGNRAPFSTWLRFATTALVVRMLDSGHIPDVVLADPVRALHQFALDPGLKVRVSSECGFPIGILDVQRSILECAQASMGVFPDWAPRVLQEWKRVLDLLTTENGWRSLVGQLDWPTKLSLFEMVLERMGWTWSRIETVNNWIDQIAENVLSDSHKTVLIDGSERSRIFHGIMRKAAKQHDADLIREFLRLKEQLATVDARYMELGGDSLFGALSKPVDAVPDFTAELAEDPLELPMPSGGRAKARAELIREHGGRSGDARGVGQTACASWTFFIANGKMLSMPDVAGHGIGDWVELASPHYADMPPPRRSGPRESLYDAIAQAESSIDSGNHHDGVNALEEVSALLDSGDVSAYLKARYWTQMVRLCARLQMESELLSATAALEQFESSRMETLWDTCNSQTWLGLAGSSRVPELASRVRAEMEVTPHFRPSGSACWKSHLAIWLNRHGRPLEALKLLKQAVDLGEYRHTSYSVQVRIHCQIAEANRMLGEYDKSAEHLGIANELCRQSGLGANRLEYVLTGWVRLHADRGETDLALRVLRESLMPEQRRLRMPAYLRSLMLSCRITPGHDDITTLQGFRDYIVSRSERYSGLATCPLLEKILHDWSAWCGGKADPYPPADAEVTDSFWGV